MSGEEQQQPAQGWNITEFFTEERPGPMSSFWNNQLPIVRYAALSPKVIRFLVLISNDIKIVNFARFI
jgi:hypothetical protein